MAPGLTLNSRSLKIVVYNYRQLHDFFCATPSQRGVAPEYCPG
ncbi:hypothetical protein CFter6_3093 [Collimonas fungivorans]|uniref:Uncharacterized protein n=1 Tax=Collimonas fungivorans TaxID=158899 RepID=A0A127PDG7_9BURK|nr:hypothetical protein CFter6_3093 [Collimonas fungivorans]